jgi:hypothetical protein
VNNKDLSLTQVIPAVVASLIGRIHTTTLARVEAYDFEAQTVDVLPLVNKVSTAGEVTRYKKLADVPLVFPAGGGGGLTFEVKRGDVGLLVFAERATDEVMVSGNQETPADPRTYHLSDGFFVPGVVPANRTGRAIYQDATELSCGTVRVVLRQGKVAVGVGGIELLSLLSDTLQALSTTTVTVMGASVPLSTALNFSALRAQLELIRGEL